MSHDPSHENRGMSTAGWMVGALVLIGVCVILLIGFLDFGRTGVADAPAAAMTPQSGSVEMPTATPTAAVIAATGGTDGEIVFLPGRKVASVSIDGAGTRVYAAPGSDKLLMDLYVDGATFTIIEPSGASSDYPVELDGQAWYRVRASDGLVGWVIVDRLVPLE